MPGLNAQLARLLFVCLLSFFALCLICPAALAQNAQTSAPVVTATAGNQRVRYSALGEVNEARLQVFSPDGTQVYDSSFRLGNLIDWALLDQQGQRLSEGSYLFLITVKEFNGTLTQRYGMARVEAERVSVSQSHLDELPAPQSAALEANKVPGSLAPVEQIGAVGPTPGNEAGNDGSVVIDDVAVSKGKTAAKNSASGGENISGTGATNRVTKWVDGPNGVVGDSAITEVNGNVGIGTSTPGGQLHIFGGVLQDVFVGMGPDLANGPAINFGYAGSTFGRGAGFLNVRPDASAVAPNPSLRFATVNQERMIITNVGNVGIGTSNPAAGVKLDVAGTINATQFKIGGAAILPTTGTGTNTFTGSGAGTANTSGAQNSFYGSSAGASNNSGSQNTFIGSNAGTANTSGNQNTFVGRNAGQANTTGATNAFFGRSAGQANTMGSSNAFFGWGAGFSNTTGANNAFFGTSAGASNTADNNAFFGNSAGFNNTAGTGNSFFGTSAGLNNTTASFNTFVGSGAGFSNSSGVSNSFFGAAAGTSNTTGNFNTFIGYFAGNANTTGTQNTFVGQGAGQANTASGNSFFGQNAGAANTTGDGNSFFGNTAGAANTTGGSNTFFGNNAGGANTTAGGNTFVGQAAGQHNTASDNSFFGNGAGLSNTSGTNNSFVGGAAGQANTTGNNNTFFGASAGFLNTADNNTFVGAGSGFVNTSGGSNTFVGNQTGVNNTMGNSNAFFGNNAGNQNTTANNNTFVGSGAGQASTGSSNTFIGQNAGVNTAAGNNNILIGTSAGSSLTNGSNNIMLGTTGPGNLNGTMILGGGSIASTVIAGIFGSNLGGGGTAVFINSNGQLGSLNSSGRFKQDIQNMGNASSKLMMLRPVTFYYKVDVAKGDQTLQYGLIAEEVEKVYPELIPVMS